MVLIFSTPPLVGEVVEGADDDVEQAHGARRPQPLGERDEALEVGEQHGGIGELVGDDGAGRALEPVDDRRRQDVVQQRVGLLLGLLGQPERVVDDDRDHGGGGDHRGDVEVVQVVRPHVEQRPLLREPGPGHEVERQAADDEGQDQLQPPETEDDEIACDGGEVLYVQAGVGPQDVREQEQPDVLGDGQGQRPGDVVETMQERHRQRDGGQHQIDVDDRLPGLRSPGPPAPARRTD